MDAARALSSFESLPVFGSKNHASFGSSPSRNGGNDNAAVMHFSRASLEASAEILSAVYSGNASRGGTAGDSGASPSSAQTDFMNQLSPDARQDLLSLASGLFGNGDGMQGLLDEMADLMRIFTGGSESPAGVQESLDGSVPAQSQQGGSLYASATHARLSVEAHMSSTTVTSSETGETVQTQTADIKFEIELDQVTVQAQDGGQATKDPLVLDLNHDGVISVTNPDSGVVFDIDGDGAKDRSAFATGGDGFLALDRNQNGVIDDGTELFGDQNGSANGFLELGKYDSNGDGKIDAADPVFSSLRILTADKDGSMILQALGAYNIQSLDLQHRDTYQPLSGGSYLAALGSYTSGDGSRHLMADAQLAYKA